MVLPVVTAVGRLLQKGGPRLYKVIAVRPDGSVQTVINTPLTSR